MDVYKKATHVIAVAVLAAAGFFMTPAGQALVHQYPYIEPLASGLAVVAALYHNPKTSQ
jgi:hypothetical protein